MHIYMCEYVEIYKYKPVFKWNKFSSEIYIQASNFAFSTMF